MIDCLLPEREEERQLYRATIPALVSSGKGRDDGLVLLHGLTDRDGQVVAEAV